MNPQDAIDFSREAIKTCMMVGGPILIASLLIGLLVGVLQAMTQVQDQTVSFVPKILLLFVMIGVCLPWLTDQMMEFARLSFEKPMTQWAGSSSPGETLFSNTKTIPPINTALAQPASNIPTRLASAPSLDLRRKSLGSLKPDSIPDSGQSSDSTETNSPAYDVQQTPDKSPFMLPHYRRISKSPTSDTGG